MHADLRLAGTLPPLDAPHHMRATEWATYREGVVLSSVPGEGSLLNVGLDKVSHVSHKPCMCCASPADLLQRFPVVCMLHASAHWGRKRRPARLLPLPSVECI